MEINCFYFPTKRKNLPNTLRIPVFSHTLYFLFQLVFVFQKADYFEHRKIGSENSTGVIYISNYMTEKNLFQHANVLKSRHFSTEKKEGR